MSEKLEKLPENQLLVSKEINEQIVSVLSSKIEGFEKIQKLHDKYIEEIDKSVEKKESDIMEV